MRYKILSLFLVLSVLGCLQVSDFSKINLNILDNCVTVYTESGYGSGVYIRKNLIMTAGHCVDSNIIRASTNKELDIQVLTSWRSSSFDVGFIKVDIKQKPIPFGNMPKILDTVYLVGTPYHLELDNTITKGIISAVYRDIFQHVGLIQTDSEGAPGSSGGPLLNANFEIIGICVAGPNPGGGVSLCEPVSHIKLALKEYDATN